VFQDGINALVSKLNLSKDTDYLRFYTKVDSRETPLKPAICRNLAVVLACLADKLAGRLSNILGMDFELHGTIELWIPAGSCHRLACLQTLQGGEEKNPPPP